MIQSADVRSWAAIQKKGVKNDFKENRELCGLGGFSETADGRQGQTGCFPRTLLEDILSWQRATQSLKCAC